MQEATRQSEGRGGSRLGVMGPITTSVRKSPGFRTWGQVESLENLQRSQQEHGAKGITEGPGGGEGYVGFILSWGPQPAGAKVRTDKGV